jgi:hypothetical protein
MIDSKQLRADILSDGKEDYTGLYEIVWSLNQKYPDVSREAKVTEARTVFADLLREDRVSVFETTWGSSNYKPVPKADATSALRNDSAWSDPTDEPYLCFATA